MTHRGFAAVGAAVALLAAVAGPLLGLRLAGEATHPTALGDVQVTVAPAFPGRVDVYIPLADWGIRARAIDAPLELAAEPRTVNRQALLRAVDGDREVVRAARDDLEAAATSAMLRALAYALLCGVALALLALAVVRAAAGVSLTRLAQAGGIAVLTVVAVCGGLLLATRWTFDAGEFEDPALYARGAELMQLLQVSEKGQQAAANYESSVERSVGGFASILSAAAELAEAPDAASLALVSDLHGNRFVLGPLGRLFAGAPIVFAGDFGHTGSAAEADTLVPRIERLGSPMVAVSGNHDSELFMRRLAAAGVTVLTERGRLQEDGSVSGGPLVEVAGLSFAGRSDPLAWSGPRPDDPNRVFSFAEREDGEREFAEAERRTIEWFDALPGRPDVVVIHQNGIAQALARHVSEQGDARPIVILTGHDHRQHVDRYADGVVAVDAGTVGAGGLLAAGQEYVGLAQVHFRGTTAALRSVDLIAFNPLTGAAEAERAIVGDDSACEREQFVCHDRGEG